jgi:hypothetical protein
MNTSLFRRFSIPTCFCLLASARITFAFNYPDFSSVAGLNLVGAATQINSNAVRLTPATTSQSGALWYAQKQYVSSGFDTAFTFKISNPGGAFGGGDGIAFSLQNFSPTSSGTEFGAASNQVSISFNTFNNFGDEPSDNFVGIVTNQYAAVRYSHTYDLNPGPIRLKDGSIHTAQFHYDANGLDLALDGISIFNDVSIPLPQGMDVGGSSWVGFGARTGDAYENQDILGWSFSVPEPSPAAVSGLGFVVWWIAARRKDRLRLDRNKF